jgi:hypothetical protein
VSRDIFSYILKLSQHDISSLNFMASATSAQVFGIGGCPTVTPQANFDLQQVSTGCETTI